ncbi:MAG TPA: hypothetical protein VNK91_01880 [Burkholderiaceae bacterium]|nr:hypothetical protein [Burkholderiaceae bacterium]
MSRLHAAELCDALIRAINARLHAPAPTPPRLLALEQQARADYEAALSRWLGGRISAFHDDGRQPPQA